MNTWQVLVRIRARGGPLSQLFFALGFRVFMCIARTWASLKTGPERGVRDQTLPGRAVRLDHLTTKMLRKEGGKSARLRRYVSQT